jgi:hypothetical protein
VQNLELTPSLKFTYAILFEYEKVSGVFHNNYLDLHKRHGMGKIHSRQYRLVPVKLTCPNRI